MRNLLSFSYLFFIILLFFYSFTQVDLSLTLSQASIWQDIQKSFQQVGYFNRPLSTIIFFILIGGLFSIYIFILKNILSGKFNLKVLSITVLITAIVLSFSYNAFSYDLFNYIFDAKIITHYHQNPYLHRALDFPGDPMLSFMQWTHRVYPYGPIWLLITTPISFIGMNIFLVTFFLFKFLISSFFLGSVYLIYKINKKINSENAIFNTAFFALNPLVVMESLVSSHNDIVMIFFALLGFNLFLVRKRVFALILVLISSQVKIPTLGLMLPFIVSFIPFKIKLDNNRFVILSIFSMLLASAYALSKIEIQPWYFLWILPLISLLKPNKYIILLSIGLSLGLALRYSVFLYFGNWGGVGVPIRNGLTIIMPIIFLIFAFIFDLYKRHFVEAR